ncbi:MAG TPA: BTAD domain-containing putative transcriptional regulator [Streptosporangiaceae bacterium]
MQVTFGVLGPVTAWDGTGKAIALKGPRHRAVLARLIVARRRVVPVGVLVGDLWDDPPPGAISAVRTFIGALRRALEPARPPRAAATLLVTEGPGYALRAGAETVDAWRFERAVAAAGALPPGQVVTGLEEALAGWRGPAYAEFAEEPWAAAECSRLAELRLRAVERRAEAQLALGRDAEAVPDLEAHVTGQPWREDAWRLLALALYRAGRQGDALAALRRARALLAGRLGVDPGPELRQLEVDILRQAGHLRPAPAPDEGAAQVWTQAALAYDRAVVPGARARLQSTVDLLRNLAVTGGGGLQAAREHREAVIEAARDTGGAELAARVIGAYDVPAIWTRSDDPRQAARIVAAAEHALARLAPGAHEATRARLLATIALESRGVRSPRGPGAARQAESIARRLDDPGLLAFALNGVFMQTFHRAGLAPRRDAIGAELITVSSRAGLVTYEILGHLVRVQALSALADFPGADRHADAADRLAGTHEIPLAGVFTQWYRALRLAAAQQAPTADVERAYRDAAARLDGAGMPGLERGLLPLALLSVRLAAGQPAGADPGPDWGPYEPWTRPLALLAAGRRPEAATAVRGIPDPPDDLLLEAVWCLVARAAIAVGDEEMMRRAHAVLTPAVGELAGAGSGLLTFGPVARHLDLLAAAIRDVR